MGRNKGVRDISVCILILTVTILACQGVSGLNPFATATPTASQTATSTPSPTPTSTPTYTPTSTPRPSGKLKEAQPDGTILFTDYDGGYQMTFSKGWTVIIPEKEDIEEALNSIPEQEQNMSSLIEIAKSVDVNKLIRVFGFNLKAQQGVYTPNINVSYDTNPALAASSLKDIVDAMAAYYPAMGIQVTHSEMKQTSSGMEIGILEAGWTMKAANNQKVSLAQKQIFFKSGDGVGILTFSTVKNASANLDDDINKLMESIHLLDW